MLLTQVLLLFKGAKDSLYAIVYKFKHKGDPLLSSFNGQLILSAVFCVGGIWKRGACFARKSVEILAWDVDGLRRFCGCTG